MISENGIICNRKRKIVWVQYNRTTVYRVGLNYADTTLDGIYWTFSNEKYSHTYSLIVPGFRDFRDFLNF